MSSVTIFALFMFALLVWNLIFPEKDEDVDPMPANHKSPKL